VAAFLAILMASTAFQAVSTPVYASAPTQWVVGDFYGDGNASLVHIRPGSLGVMRRWAGNFFPPKVVLPYPGYVTNPAGTRWLSGDMNGDGRSDLVHLWPGGINTLFADPVGNPTRIFNIDRKREARKPFPDYAMNVLTTRTRWLTADANGDGRTDLIHLWSGGINTLLSDGNGGYRLDRRTMEGQKPYLGQTQQLGYAMNVATTAWRTGEVNGDGKADLIHLWSGGINTLVSDGAGRYTIQLNGWKPKSKWGNGNYQMNVTTTHWVAADASGDGRTDLVHIWPGGFNTLVKSQTEAKFDLMMEGWRFGYGDSPTYLPPDIFLPARLEAAEWLVGGDLGSHRRVDLLRISPDGIYEMFANGAGRYPDIVGPWKPAGYDMGLT
jgi:hypothetical protein